MFALGVKAFIMVLGLMGHASMAGCFADSGVAMLCVDQFNQDIKV